MTYATATALLTRFDAAEIAQRVDRGVPRLVTAELLTAVAAGASLVDYTLEEAARGAVALTVVTRALQDADDTINSYLAGRYTLLDRTGAAEVLPKCLAAGTGVVIGGVFNSGILATGAVPGAHHDYGPASADIITRVNAMEAGAKAQGSTLPAAAMRFVLDHPAVASVLIGSAKASSLSRNAALLRDAPALNWSAFDADAVT